jgi:hypothetical protein
MVGTPRRVREGVSNGYGLKERWRYFRTTRTSTNSVLRWLARRPGGDHDELSASQLLSSVEVLHPIGLPRLTTIGRERLLPVT